jgi:hypothetical protein
MSDKELALSAEPPRADDKAARDLTCALRVRNVWRWNIVNIQRRQSVAEHSYLVWAIGVFLYRRCARQVESRELESITTKLLTHDFEEALISDLPTPVKHALDRIAPGAVRRAVAEVYGLGDLPNMVDLHWTDRLVKLADLAESLLFVKHNHTGDLYADLQERLDLMVTAYATNHRDDPVNWLLAGALINNEVMAQ